LSAAIDTTPVLGRGAVKDTFNLVSDGIRRVVDEACALKDWEREEVVATEGLSRHFATSFKGALDVAWSEAALRAGLDGTLLTGGARTQPILLMLRTPITRAPLSFTVRRSISRQAFPA
jgi:hypothetical protein